MNECPLRQATICMMPDCRTPDGRAGEIAITATRVLPRRARMRAWTSLTALFVPSAAYAHNEVTFDPWIVASLVPLVFVRPRAAWPFAGALLALFLALFWPLEALTETSFAAHMAQHMLLIGVAAPLIAVSRPVLPFMKGRRALARPVLALAKPLSAFLLHGAAIWLAHAPALLEWSLDSRPMHALQHFALVATAALFWWSLFARGRAGAGEAALWSLATLVHTGALGALLTFAPRRLYPSYGLEDQQFAGLVMWVPGGACYIAAGMAFAAVWLIQRGRPTERR
jgi:cytochrome c oxidase assembly factor CtaG